MTVRKSRSVPASIAGGAHAANACEASNYGGGEVPEGFFSPTLDATGNSVVSSQDAGKHTDATSAAARTARTLNGTNVFGRATSVYNYTGNTFWDRTRVLSRPAANINGVVPDVDEPPSKLDQVYTATAFTEQALEASVHTPDVEGPESKLGYSFKLRTTVNKVGWLLFLFYLGAFGFYLYVRTTQTLNLGRKYTWYGVVMLVVECFGATTIMNYGINLLWDPVYTQIQDDPRKPGCSKVKLPYHIRVLICCYKEDLDCVQRTIECAASALLPYGCTRTIYLCDDRKDPEKQEWIASLGSGYVYVGGRTRPKGEMNGKSGNLNNVCSQIYPPGLPIPGNEIICIFDADQMAKPEFFNRTVPLLDEGDDVAMVLSPQAFHNLNLNADVFNHSNIHFWEYMQPGADAVGFISCTGTNFLIRANAFQKVGWSPTYTMTEDYALGMELKKASYWARYVREYLALGEAPDQVRNCFQQRSRWTKGHFQIAFNPRVCPLFQTKLSWPMRLLYFSGVWNYVISSISTPFFAMIPVITIWIGVFPLAISRQLALAMTIYAVAIYALLYYCRHPIHIRSLWFANVANQILFWAFLKAFFRALTAQTLTFKATAKGKARLNALPTRDLAPHIILFVILSASVVCAVIQMANGSKTVSPLLISILWAVYSAIPSTLILYYTILRNGIGFRILCRVAQFLYIGCAAAAIVIVWSLHNYNPREFASAQSGGHNIGLYFKQRFG